MSSETTSNSYYSTSSSSMDRSDSFTTLLDIEDDTSRGISLRNFLMLAFRLKTEEFSELRSQARAWTKEDDFVSKLEEYRANTNERTPCCIKSMKDLGNIVLKKAMKDHKIPVERQVKLLSTNDLDIHEGRGPDIAVIPANVENTDLLDLKRFDWRRALGAIQIWFPPNSSGRKRKSQSTADTDVAQGPPPKRSRSPTSKDVASAIPSAGVDTEKEGVKEQQQCHAERTTQDIDSHSLSDTSTDVDASRSSTSRWSNDAGIYEHSAEGEIVELFTDAFSTRGDRTFAIGACTYGMRMKLMFCSHTGVIESNEIDLARKPELFAIFLLMYATSSLPDLGFNAKTGFCNPFSDDDAETQRVNIAFESGYRSNNQLEQPNLSDVRQGQKIFAHSGLVGRATTVYRLECPSYSQQLVMKYSWQAKKHRREDEVILAAREADPIHTPELFVSAVIDDDCPFDLLREGCQRKSKSYEPRELRILVMREYTPLAELGFGDEFWDAFVQLLGCVHDLFRKKRILHHDISMKNLAFYRDEGGKPVAVLIDYDLATVFPANAHKSTERVGTLPFMSHSVLIKPDCLYGLHHDLESFLYCVVWHGLGYEMSEKFPCKEGSEEDILKCWRSGSYVTMGGSKIEFLTSSDGLKILGYIPDKSFARKCKLLWRKFMKTMVAEDTDSEDDVGPGFEARKGAPPTMVTYPMLMQALGHEITPCGDACCSGRRSAIKRQALGLHV